MRLDMMALHHSAPHQNSQDICETVIEIGVGIMERSRLGLAGQEE